MQNVDYIERQTNFVLPHYILILKQLNLSLPVIYKTIYVINQ